MRGIFGIGRWPTAQWQPSQTTPALTLPSRQPDADRPLPGPDGYMRGIFGIGLCHRDRPMLAARQAFEALGGDPGVPERHRKPPNDREIAHAPNNPNWQLPPPCNQSLPSNDCLTIAIQSLTMTIALPNPSPQLLIHKYNHSLLPTSEQLPERDRTELSDSIALQQSDSPSRARHLTTTLCDRSLPEPATELSLTSRKMSAGDHSGKHYRRSHTRDIADEARLSAIACSLPLLAA